MHTHAVYLRNRDPARLSSSSSVSVQITELFARSSVSCLTGVELQGVTAERGDPCWQVTQQLHLLIEKVTSPPSSAKFCNPTVWTWSDTEPPMKRFQPSSIRINDRLFGPELCDLRWIRIPPPTGVLRTHVCAHAHARTAANR